jgi:hypothetical protein
MNDDWSLTRYFKTSKVSMVTEFKYPNISVHKFRIFSLRTFAEMTPNNVCEISMQCYVLLKDFVFWDVAPCRSCVSLRFGGTYRLHLQGRKIREWGISMGRWLRCVPPKCRLTQHLHGTTSQKTEFFIVTIMKTSDLTYLDMFAWLKWTLYAV